jgi:hypothetical protein
MVLCIEPLAGLDALGTQPLLPRFDTQSTDGFKDGTLQSFDTFEPDTLHRGIQHDSVHLDVHNHAPVVRLASCPSPRFRGLKLLCVFERNPAS